MGGESRTKPSAVLGTGIQQTVTMRKGNLLLITASFLLSFVPGCTGPDQACPPEVPPPIEVNVHHVETGEPLDALAIARDGTYADSVRTHSGRAWLAVERNQAATYEVTVEKDGFQTWTRSDVSVEIGKCNYPITVELDVDLVPF